MRKKSGYSRREFMAGTLSAGAAFVFTVSVQGEEEKGSLGDFGIPLAVERIGQPAGDRCLWAGFSPVNDQVAFISQVNGEKPGLYVSRAGEPNNFDLLWKPTNVTCGIIGSAAWSPDGREIALLVRTDYRGPSVTTGKQKLPIHSVFITDVVSGATRELTTIRETVFFSLYTSVITTYVVSGNALCWRTDDCVCVATDNSGVLKFDKVTGQRDVLIAPQERNSTTSTALTPPGEVANLYLLNPVITSIALTPSGELRFVKAKRTEKRSPIEYTVGGLRQDGTICDYGNLNQQFGKIEAQLSQDGNFVFFQKAGKKVQEKFLPSTTFIYSIESRRLAGQIPVRVKHHNDRYIDSYMYIPLNVQNEKDLLLIEVSDVAMDDGSSRNLQRAAKMPISPEKQYKTSVPEDPNWPYI